MNHFDLKVFQAEVERWTGTNFPNAEKIDPILGVAEEAGELCHAALKMKQSIRISEDHAANAVDAIGDIVIYLADVCNKYDWDLETCIEITWNAVKKRDWRNNPKTGK